MEEQYEFQLPWKEFEYLEQLALSAESLANILRCQKGTPGRRVTLRLSRADAVQIREYLSTQLPIVGFDENYFPNEQGQMLEELIDRFFLR